MDNILLNKETQTDLSNNQSEYKDKSINVNFASQKWKIMANYKFIILLLIDGSF